MQFSIDPSSLPLLRDEPEQCKKNSHSSTQPRARSRSLSPQRRSPKLRHTNGRLHADPLAVVPGDDLADCTGVGDVMNDVDAADDFVCDLLSEGELLRVIHQQPETQKKSTDNVATTRLRRESHSFPPRTDVRRSISCVDSGDTDGSGGHNTVGMTSSSTGDGGTTAGVLFTPAHQRFKIFYRDEALRESCAKNTRRMIEQARLARQSSTLPPRQDTLTSSSTDGTASDAPPVSSVSNQQQIAWKALRYRKLLGRMDEIDASRLNDPSFDVLECLGVQWCKVAREEKICTAFIRQSPLSLPIMKFRVSLLMLTACGFVVAALAPISTTTAVSSSDAMNQPMAEPEPAWGRIYLRRGLGPIQYFRDRYGGSMATGELEFYFPRHDDDRLGCALLPAEEQATIRASNGSIALVLDRGVCTFETKSRLAQQMGAAALVIVSEGESAKAPVAIVDKGEIEIATSMVRKSAGDLLRLVAARERIYGRLLPMVCARKPNGCKPRTANETQYIDDQSARSGVVVARATNAIMGDFLAASYGGILPSGSLRLPRGAAPIDGCGELDAKLFSGKVALFAVAGDWDGCSVLDRVSSAQRAGAVAALVAMGEMKRPAVAQSWHAYNITIAAAAISPATLGKLVQWQQQQEDHEEIRLNMRNRIADAWDQVRRLSVKAAWPTRKDRQQRLLQQVVGSFELDNGQLLELKHNYLTVAGGSGTAWDNAVAPLLHKANAGEDTDVDHEQLSEVVIDAAGV